MLQSAERAKLTLFPTGGHTDQTMNLAGLGQGEAPYDVYDESIYDWLLAHIRTPGAPASQTANAAGILAGAPESAAQVAAMVEPVVVALTVNRATIRLGQPATLAWTAAGAGPVWHRATGPAGGPRGEPSPLCRLLPVPTAMS